MNCIDNAVGWVKSLAGVNDLRAWEIFALMAETHRYTPLRWRRPLEQNGRDGVPPPHAIRTVIANAHKFSLVMRRDHFFTAPPDPISPPKPGRPVVKRQ